MSGSLTDALAALALEILTSPPLPSASLRPSPSVASMESFGVSSRLMEILNMIVAIPSLVFK